MVVTLILSTLTAGTIAVAITLAILYLPTLWGGRPYDVLNALGSAVTRRVDARTTAVGLAIYGLGGLFFALLYGLVVQALIAGAGAPPPLLPVMGAVLGLAHGGIVALLITVIVIEHHPLEQFRERYRLVVSQIVAHIVFGLSVTVLHGRFL